MFLWWVVPGRASEEGVSREWASWTNDFIFFKGIIVISDMTVGMRSDMDKTEVSMDASPYPYH